MDAGMPPVHALSKFDRMPACCRYCKQVGLNAGTLVASTQFNLIPVPVR